MHVSHHSLYYIDNHCSKFMYTCFISGSIQEIRVHVIYNEKKEEGKLTFFIEFSTFL